MGTLAFDVVSLWSEWVWPILQFLIGLSVVVSVHELGHFLVAKWVGIKVERFALGFGPNLLAFTRGETEYCLKIIPLGGYVKMLGQEDFKPLTEDDKPDPRAYSSKSIGARFAVIAAGVVMNVILAAILFVIVGMVGMEFRAPVVGQAAPTYPAAKVLLYWRLEETPAQSATQPASQPAFEKGLRGGDRILQIGGREVTRFRDVSMVAALADFGEKVPVVVERTDEAGRKWIGQGYIGVKTDPTRGILAFGMSPADDVVFAKDKKVISDSPFESGDRLVAIDGKPVEHSWQIEGIEKTLNGRPVKVTVERKGENRSFDVQPTLRTGAKVIWLADGRRIHGYELPQEEDKPDKRRIEPADGGAVIEVAKIEVAKDDIVGGAGKELLDILGMIPRVKVDAVVGGGPADDAGLKPSDVITDYAERGPPTFDQLREINKKYVGQETAIQVLRGRERHTFRIQPKSSGDSYVIEVTVEPELSRAHLAGVREGSPAARAGLVAGDVVRKVNGREVETWIDVFSALRELDGREVVRRVNGQEVETRIGIYSMPELDGRKVVLTIERRGRLSEVSLGTLSESVFDPGDYHLSVLGGAVFLKPLMVTVRKGNPLSAVAWGVEETRYFIVITYGTIRALLRNTASTKSVTGPVGIGRAAVGLGREKGLIDFVYFMAFISAVVAVMNFLPWPVLDGGHAVFLLIEKIRRKPLPVKVMNAIQMAGLAVILLVFVLITWQDILRLF